MPQIHNFLNFSHYCISCPTTLDQVINQVCQASDHLINHFIQLCGTGNKIVAEFLEVVDLQHIGNYVRPRSTWDTGLGQHCSRCFKASSHPVTAWLSFYW